MCNGFLKGFLSILILISMVGCYKVQNHIDVLFKERETPSYLVTQPSKNPSKVKIGIFLPLSGKHKYLGQSMMDAIQLAIYEFNVEDIELQVIDVGSDEASAKEVIHSVNFVDIDIILGPVFKEQADILYSYALANNLVMITYSNSIELMYKPALYIFDFIPSQQIKRVLSYASENKYKDIYSIVPKDIYGKLVKKILLKNQEKNAYNVKKIALYTGYNVAATKRFTLSDAIFDVKSSIKEGYLNASTKLSDTAILLPENNANLLTTINQLQLLHSTKDPKYKILGIGDWNEYPLKQNLITQEAWISDIPHKLLYEFNDRFIEAYKYKPPRLAAVAYDSITLISAIFNKRDDKIMIEFQKLETADGHQGVTGLFRFMSNGSNERLYSVYQYQNSRMKEIMTAASNF
jgi:ABC-type branched-subunit amino acid transport system substrate-binding protein